jgi:hypothetical protein
MGIHLRHAFDEELRQARGFEDIGDLVRAWQSLERAHILGQRSTRLHVRSHLHMLRHAWQRHDRREIVGQLARILGAVLFSRIWIPEGNTGGANIIAFRTLPIPADLQRILDEDAR